MSQPDYLEEIKSHLKKQKVPEHPEAAVILGSGLGGFSSSIENPVRIKYDTIPHFPETSVAGHEGVLVSGTVKDKPVIAFSGRFHHYEGFSFKQAALPVYVAHALNAEKLIISNAAGGINRTFNVGDLMVIHDIIRQNLAISPAGTRQYRYSHYPWCKKVVELGSELGIHLRQGTYLYAKGPNYETKAEIRAFRVMGADAVGMSTAPELMVASRLNMKTAAISLISNMAAGVHPGKLSHEEVSEAAGLRKDDFENLVKALVEFL